MRCLACGKDLYPSDMFLFELSLDKKKVKESDFTQKGMTCRDLMCLAIATGCAEEEE